MRIHIVQKGDTLWKLAQKYGVDFEALKAANSHLSNPDLIMPGMKIKIPSGKVQATKELGKKEAPIYGGMKKEQPIVKEAPKKKTPPPSIKEEKEMPVPLPAPPVAPVPQPSPSLHLQKMNMNLNIYKQNKETEITIPVQPVKETPVEAQKTIEAPKPITPPVKKPLKAEKKPEMVKPKPMPAPKMEMPMFNYCYPVTPLFQYPAIPCPPNLIPMPLQPVAYPNPQPMCWPTPMPIPMAGHGQFAPQGFLDTQPQAMMDEGMMPVDHGDVGNVQGFGDVTAQQFQSTETGVGHHAPSMSTPWAQQHPFPMQTMTNQPYFAQGFNPYAMVPPFQPFQGQQGFMNTPWSFREAQDEDDNE